MGRHEDHLHICFHSFHKAALFLLARKSDGVAPTNKDYSLATRVLAYCFGHKGLGRQPW